MSVALSVAAGAVPGSPWAKVVPWRKIHGEIGVERRMMEGRIVGKIDGKNWRNRSIANGGVIFGVIVFEWENHLENFGK
jgi:hypothetical protein